MRTNGTKYDKVDSLPADALPVSEYFRRNSDSISSTSYLHIKYDRHRFGYSGSNGTKFAPYPGYRIIDYFGQCYVTETKD